MEVYKSGTVNTTINENGVDLGNINVNLYTMDNKTSVIDIHIKKKNIINENQEYISVNFNQTKFEPVLHVFAQDGSIFTNEPLEIVKAEEGFVRYIIPEYITKHVGQMQCKLFLENPENNDSTHVANFYFTVNDSGITKSVGKEIRVELLDDIVEKVMKDNVDIFKGPKGDIGEQGPAGQDGKDGKNGINGIDGINGNPGPQGPPGRDGKDGVDGKSFDFDSLTDEQKNSLKPELPDFSNWQKYKTTNDDGTNFYDTTLIVDFNDGQQLLALPNGVRYIVNTKNVPNGATSQNGWLTKYSRSDLGSILLQYQPYNAGTIYQKTYYNKSWSDWQVINPDYSKTLNWQRYKLTNDDGERISLGTLNQKIETLEPGFYECTIPSNNSAVNPPPDNATSSYVAQINVTKSTSGRKQILLIQSYSENIYYKSIHTNGNDRGWVLLNQLPSSDTGWIPLPLVNGAAPDVYSDVYLPVSYRVRKNGDNNTVQIIGNIKNLSTGLVFAQLPSDVTPVRNIEYKLNQRIGTSSAAAYLASDGTMKVVGALESGSTYMINLTYMV
ncbi:BppU family phage baseplate upper protein [Staphylococcus caprae]|uniref:BppU family phage baseplate upper protein n=1 Tax=Staphylococcus caprae TaxID=29380 RepID=UPI0019D1164D|nr:BppU family phage baseplate upper protein [Staphylococcus caprae]MBN6824761.1 BppU family phage baseplate upper protein [Staphylococcus caprae]